MKKYIISTIGLIFCTVIAFYSVKSFHNSATACTPNNSFTLVCNSSCTNEALEIKESEAEHLSHYHEEDVRAAKNAISQKINMSEYTITSETGFDIPLTYFDRNSSKLLVVGPGFQNNREMFYFVARLFNEYDVVVFDYRWHELKKFVLQRSTLTHPINELLLKEKEEIITVVRHMKQKKQYATIVGHGICYSTYTLLAAQDEAQQQGEKLFDKLILDSTFYSIPEMVRKIINDPWLIDEPQVNYTSSWFKAFVKYTGLELLIVSLTKLMGYTSVEPLVSRIVDTPILFIHGKEDVLIPLEDQFLNIWEQTQTQKYALFTPFPHVKNMRNRGIFKCMCEAFINTDDTNSFMADIHEKLQEVC